MKTTADFLDALRAKFGATSDYQLGPVLKMQRQRISHYRLMKGTFDDDVSVRVAELLDVDPAYVIACMHAQRTDNTRLRAIWEGIADRAGSIAAALVVAVIVAGAQEWDSSAFAAQISKLAAAPSTTLCIMLNAALAAAASLLLYRPKK